MRTAYVYRNGQRAGTLTRHSQHSYEFRYDDAWFANENMPPISLSLPKTKQIHHADHLFPFFFNMLSEGVNRQLQCRQLKIDEDDYFGLLLATAATDTTGAVTVKPADSK